jgi:hypothetical protein
VRTARWAALTLICAAGAAEAAPQWLLGASTGLSLPGGALSAGPTVGVGGTVAPWRQLAFELLAESSFHWVQRTDGTVPFWLASVSAGGQYRIDVASAVPYAAVRIIGQRGALAGAQAQYGLAGGLALGVWVPLGSALYAGAEARYGFVFTSTAFPVGSGFVLTFGWRIG